MKDQSVEEERRRGLRLVVIGALLLVPAGALVWLVYHTNPSGEHDAWAIPLAGLIPMAIGIVRVLHARWRSTHALGTSAT